MSKPSNPESVRVKVNRPDPLAFRGAAFALTETAFVLLGPGAGEAALWPRDGGGGKLAAQFKLEYAEQVRRWKILRAGVRGKVEALALAVAGAAAAGPEDFPRLPKEDAARIAALVDEGGPSASDPLGIRRHWDENPERRK